jgi:PAS domain S-box-containing protein
VTARSGLPGSWQVPASSYIEDYAVGGSWLHMGPQSEPRVSGYTVEELAVPNFWKTLLHPGDRDRVLAEDEWSDRNLEPWQTSYRIIARDGRTVWVRDEAFLVYDDTGEPAYWQGVVFNATDRMLAQLEATRRLQALDHLRDTFLSAVSHELRTPLTTVLGACATLQRAGGRLPEETRAELLQGVTAGARRLDRLLTDLIDLERLGWGAVTLERRPVDLASLLERVAARFRREGPWPCVSADLEDTVLLDADKVERIVDALLANTAKHTPPGTPVWVGARPHDGGVLLTVDDAGPGVPSELRAQVFERFRHGAGVPSYSPGLGIGLSLVLRLAELHGGTAWVEDRPGGGSSFRVVLPGPPS